MRTIAEAKKMMSHHPLSVGEERSYRQCRTCGHIWVCDYIPYGLGKGRQYDPCICFLTGNDRRKGHEELELETRTH